MRGTPSWMLSAWPIPDPDDYPPDAQPVADPSRLDDLGPPLDLGGGAYPGSPKAKGPDRTREAVENQRYMMPMVAEHTQIVDCSERFNPGRPGSPLAITTGSSVLKQELEAKEAFEQFQVMGAGVGTNSYLHAFDLALAMEAFGISIDDTQQAELMRAFGLAPRDCITWEHFKHMTEVISSGQLGRSPPRVHDGVVPGSPEWVSDKVEKEKKPKDKDKPAPKQAARAGYEKWMLNSMGDKGVGVDVPDRVRKQIEHRPVEALDKPNLDWSPFESHRH